MSCIIFWYLLSIIGLKILADKRNPRNIFSRIIIAENKLLRRKKSKGKLSLFVSFALFLGLIATGYAITRPSLKNKLQQTWIMHELTYQGCQIEFGHLTMNGFNISFNGISNSLSFQSNNSVRLPGIESTSIEGRWQLEGDSLLITSTVTHGEIYAHKYAVEFNGDSLKMNSGVTEIKATRLF